ncbi:MAG TPA: beta-N-acetylhexosaminidase, partial [Clostridia bacterium]|nr:beta-N-acetylhexosaminidase [Clostridia bacterium]
CILTLLPGLRTGEGEAHIRFAYDASLPEEAYRLVCGEGGVDVFASGVAGAVFGAATLRQLLAGGGGIPYGEIEDAPRFPWRGISLDVCRHFFPVKTVKKLVDALALYKYNTLHLHLSDDQGFRVESERFPRLNFVGSFRESSAVKRGAGETQDGVPYGGYYTKAEIKDLIAYAAARGMRIIPEIDLPGHTTAMIAAYPELACDGRETKVAAGYGLKDFSAHILCAGDEKVYAFLEELIDELCELFPAPFFHLGGDEAVKTEWRKCPKCQAKIRELNLSGERALQGHMLERLRNHLTSRGKEAIIWNDGLAETTGTEFVCQHWLNTLQGGKRRTVRHLNGGGRAVMSDFFRLYFDYPYAMTPLKKTYKYRIIPRGVTGEAASRVLGGECAMWTEWVEDETKLLFNLLPRLAAAGEVFWSEPSGMSYSGFVERLPAQYRLYEEMGMPYARGMERAKGRIARLKTVRIFYKTDAYIELPRR